MAQNRPIAGRHRGIQHGPITRLISPTDGGDLLKPFIFLDFFHATVASGFGFGMHPHSGIATLTWQPGCDVRYQDTTGQSGLLRAGGLEWMNAGGGAWHQASLETDGQAMGFQLWVAMPPGVEDGPAFGQYVPPEAVPTLGFEGGLLTLLLGELALGDQTIRSPIDSHQAMNYFVLDLAANASWSYAAPEQHDVAWAFVFDGSARVAGHEHFRELLTIEGKGAIHFETGREPARVLVGSAHQHPFDLVVGPSSVHTNRASLQQGHERIRQIGQRLARQGGRTG